MAKTPAKGFLIFNVFWYTQCGRRFQHSFITIGFWGLLTASHSWVLGAGFWILDIGTTVFICMILENISLSRYSNYMIGGVARYFCLADGLHAAFSAVRFAHEKKLPLFVLGGGTNVLFNDEGFPGLVLKFDVRFIAAMHSLPETAVVTVGAGVPVHELLLFCIERGLSGLEWAGGLPGTVGGAVRGNAGAFKGEIKDSLVDVISIDSLGGAPRLVKRANTECAFAYRDSIFKQRGKKEIILAATFLLLRGNRARISHAIQEKINWRANRQPLDYPNVGSIFKNVAVARCPAAMRELSEIKKHIKSDPFPVIPAAYLIDQTGLKGVSYGGAMVSQKHPNFIVNAGAAESAHVQQLIKLVKTKVKKKFHVELEEEIVYI